ncbi:PREDICTED: RING finger protein 207 [Myotis davidii]|uniref:RING finger protein 207 n=1 Tax=Myotis davidii TaxID=225400 RepID=UPI0007672312|nr:PREDICTED: RING finger protein 207 [Myotis davidii]
MAAAEAERERSALRRREEPHRAEHVGPRPYQSLRPAPGSSLHPVLYHRGAIAFAFEGLEDGQGLGGLSHCEGHQTVVKGPSGLPPVDQLLQFLVDSSGDALGQRRRDVLQKCALHAEPYLMFSTDKKSLLCIRCFRDLQGWVEGAGEEEAPIHSLFGSLQDKLAERKALLLQAVQSQYEEKDKAFKEQLSHLATLLPTLQVHLVICSSFLSLASKAEFLDLGYVSPQLLRGLPLQHGVSQSTTEGWQPVTWRREQGSLGLPSPLPHHHLQAGTKGGPAFPPSHSPAPHLHPHWFSPRLAGVSGPKVLGPSCPSPVGKMLGSPVQKPTLHRSIGTKVLLAEGEDTPFAEHCRHYEDSYRHLQAEMQSLKDQVQELHRDLTKHHSLIKAEIMADILRKALQVDAQIGSEYASVEGMRAAFQEMWEESYQRVADEQEIYEAQLHDLLQLKQENACLTTITKQITPYVRSIAKVKERLEPRFQAPVDEESEQLQDLGDDSTKDEAQARSDPACGADKRETSEPRGNSRTQQSLAEEPPLQSKDPHGPKARNGGDVPPRRERPT